MPKASGYAKIDTKGRWFLRYKLPDGTDTRKILGYAHEADMPDFTEDRGEDFITKERAEEMLAEILAPWRDWTDDSDPTFWQAAQEFLRDCREKERRGTTIEEYDRICLRIYAHLKAYGMSDEDRNSRRLSKISERIMLDLRAEMACINQTKTVLAGIVRVARKKHKYTGPDFSEWFERAPVKRKLEIEVYTPTEVEKIASCADPEIAAIIRVAAYTGLRMSELRALTWGDVDFTGEKITVRRRYTDTDGIQPPKNGKARTVPMARQVSHMLREHYRGFRAVRDSTEFVFGYGWVVKDPRGEAVSGYPLSYDYISSGFHAAIDRSRVRRLRFHDLRHVFGSTMVQRFPLSTVQEWMGHASIQTTQRYIHHVPRHDDARRISDLLTADETH